MTAYSFPGGAVGARSSRVVVIPAVTLAVGAGIAALRWPLPVLAAAIGIAVVSAIAARPVLGVYLLVVLTPLTAGIAVGSTLRPNELLDVLVAIAVLVRWLVDLRSARDISVRADAVSVSLVAMAVAGSVLPLIWLRLRGTTPTRDDLLYALVLWKLLAIYVIVRAIGITDRQRVRCLQLSVATAVVVGLIGALQAMGFGPVIRFLSAYYTTNGNLGEISSGRGGSTLDLSIAVADLAIINLAIVVGLIWTRRRASLPLVLAGFALVGAVVSAAEFSGAIGLVVGLIALCVGMRSRRPLRYAVPGIALALAVLWPVVQTRLAGFNSTSGLPVSWTGRLTNLRTYFWPQLFAHHNYLLGIRPAARVLAPHRAAGYIWIESGYTWLLWAGGIPLLLAYAWFSVAAGRAGLRAVFAAADGRRVAGLAVFVAICVVAVSMLFDPHLTYRGSGDELFMLLALSLPAVRRPVGGNHA